MALVSSNVAWILQDLNWKALTLGSLKIDWIYWNVTSVLGVTAVFGLYAKIRILVRATFLVVSVTIFQPQVGTKWLYAPTLKTCLYTPCSLFAIGRRQSFYIVYNNNNTQIAAIALLPSTTHP